MALNTILNLIHLNQNNLLFRSGYDNLRGRRRWYFFFDRIFVADLFELHFAVIGKQLFYLAEKVPFAMNNNNDRFPKIGQKMFNNPEQKLE